MPVTPNQPIGSKARLITVTQSGLPVVPVAELTRPARVAMGDETNTFEQNLQSGKLGPSAAMQSFEAALPSGATCIVHSDDPGDPRGLALAVTRPATAAPNTGAMLRYALIVQDEVPQTKDRSNPDQPPPSILQHETVILDDVPADSAHAAFVVPFRMTDSPTQAVAFLVEVSPASQDQAYLDAFASSLQAIKASAENASKRPAFGPLQADAFSGYDRALRAATSPRSRRAAIIFLANQTDATLCADVALGSDDATLATLADRISKRLSAGPTTRSTQSLGWLLDLSAFELLSELQSNNKLPAGLDAVLTIHCGEVGRHASSLEEIVKGLSGRQDFENRLLAENLIDLEDSSPASRVRAYDWLRALGRAPAGYDPLADLKQRREALDRATNPTTQQAQP